MKLFLSLLVLTSLLITNAAVAAKPKSQPAWLLHQPQFTRTISKGGECSYPDIPCQKNITVYMPIKQAKSGNADELWVNTDSLVKRFGSSEHKQGLKDFDAFLEQPSDSLQTGVLLTDPLRVFDDGMEYESRLIGTVDVNYPAVDKYHAVYSMDGQDFPGAVIVRIFARKNETMMMMKGAVSDSSQKERINKCYPSGIWPYTYKLTEAQEKEVEACYLKSIQVDATLQQAIHQKAENLASLFALKTSAKSAH